MQTSIKEAYLYVEEYDKRNLLVDFINKNEFLSFASNDDNSNNIDFNQYIPTMLYFRNVNNLNLNNGDIIIVSMQALITHKMQTYSFIANTENDESPYTVFMTFNDGSWLEDLFRTNEARKKKRLYNKFLEPIKKSTVGATLSTLDKLSDRIIIEVVDVSQGSTNLIHSNNQLTIFDLGTHKYAKETELKCIANTISTKINVASKTSLIISHWDVDHYNILTVLDEKYLEKLCFVTFPNMAITLTSKQVLKKLQDNCKYLIPFTPPIRKKANDIAIVPIIEQSTYTLYIGEKSSSTNKSGLALAIKTSNATTIFGADHTNKQVWEQIYPHITTDNDKNPLNMVVPHHGGYCGKIDTSHISINPGIAAIPVGKNNYNHPDTRTINMYNDLKFDVKRTDWERKNIIIEM